MSVPITYRQKMDFSSCVYYGQFSKIRSHMFMLILEGLLEACVHACLHT